jgi:hypothetical protein
VIVEGIRQMHAAGGDLTSSRSSRQNLRLVAGARAYFGSWPRAVEAAGFDYTRVREAGKEHRRQAITKWTPESTMRELRRLWELGEDVRASTILARSPGMYGPIRKQYHSWQTALRAAGIDPRLAATAARTRRGWKHRWLQQLKVQASGRDQACEVLAPDQRRGFALSDATLPSEWLANLVAGSKR